MKNLQHALSYLRGELNVTGVKVSPPQNSPLHLRDELGHSSDLFLNFDPVMGWNTLANKNYDISKTKNFLKILEKLDAPNFTLIDVGANIGLFSRQLISLAGARFNNLICYEPHPTNFELLVSNLKAVQNCIFHNCAIGVTDGIFELLVDKDNAGNYSLSDKAVLEDRRAINIEVEVRNAHDEFRKIMEENRQPFIYKSDTQGFDQKIACAIPDEFWMRVKLGVFECWRLPSNEYDEDKFASVLDKFEFLAFEKNFGTMVKASRVIDYLRADDRQFDDLYVWR